MTNKKVINAMIINVYVFITTNNSICTFVSLVLITNKNTTFKLQDYTT